MPGRVERTSAKYSSLDLRGEINRYFSRNFDDPAMHKVAGFAKDIRDSAYDPHKRFGKHLVVIPTANDERGATLHHTGAIYAREAKQTPSGITVIYGLNRPAGEQRNPDLVDAYHHAQQHFPQLDMRFVDLGEQPSNDQFGNQIDCIIPKIEKELVASALYALIVHPFMEEDVLLHIHDLDTRRLSRGFFNAEEDIHAQYPDSPLMPRAEHTVYPLKPRISEAIMYADMEFAFSRKVPIYETAITIPAITYCRTDGITDNGSIGQIIDFIGRAEPPLVLVEDAEFFTSGRRLAERYATTSAPTWTENFEYEGLEYRRKRPKRDISNERQGLAISCNSEYLVRCFDRDILEYASGLKETHGDFPSTRNALWDWIRDRLRTAQKKILRTSATVQYDEFPPPLQMDMYEHVLTQQLDGDYSQYWGSPEFFYMYNSYISGLKALQTIFHSKLKYEELQGIPSVEQYILTVQMPNLDPYTRYWYLRHSLWEPFIAARERAINQ